MGSLWLQESVQGNGCSGSGPFFCHSVCYVDLVCRHMCHTNRKIYLESCYNFQD